MSCQRDKVLVIGGSGYIGSYLTSSLDDTYQVFSTYYSHKENISSGEAIYLDITDSDSVVQVFRDVRPSHSYLLSYSLDNLEGTIVKGASHVINAARSLASPVIFLSTDVVFGGKKTTYYEDDFPDYVNAYGRAKREAESIVLAAGGIVVRTSLVYGFLPMDVRTSQLLQDLEEGYTRISYFSDEFRCPIFVEDLCTMLMKLIKRDSPRILHMTGPECMSRLEFARRIAHSFKLDLNKIKSALLKESGLNRPYCLCLDSSLAQITLNYQIRSVGEVLSAHVIDGRVRNVH